MMLRPSIHATLALYNAAPAFGEVLSSPPDSLGAVGGSSASLALPRLSCAFLHAVAHCNAKLRRRSPVSPPLLSVSTGANFLPFLLF